VKRPSCSTANPNTVVSLGYTRRKRLGSGGSHPRGVTTRWCPGGTRGDGAAAALYSSRHAAPAEPEATSDPDPP
jgi:hypothetical protein